MYSEFSSAKKCSKPDAKYSPKEVAEYGDIKRLDDNNASLSYPTVLNKKLSKSLVSSDLR